MQTNLFFLCGPHGSGKTTLGEELAKENWNIHIPEIVTATAVLNAEPKDRLALKICQRSLENFEYLQEARKNPEKIILGNRCIYDQQVYNRVYSLRGWIKEKERKKYDLLAEYFYADALKHPYAIVLNPGFEAVKRHLEKRWKDYGRKWRESDMKYAALACSAYEMLKSNKNVFYIDHEVDLESRAEITQVHEWLMRKSGIKNWAVELRENIEAWAKTRSKGESLVTVQ